MADTVLDFLLEDLKLIVSKNTCFIISDMDQIKSVYNDFTVVRSFLRQLKDDHNGDCFLEQVKDLACEALEDLDSFILNVILKEDEEMCGKIYHAFDPPKKLRYIAEAINSIKKKMEKNPHAVSMPILEVSTQSISEAIRPQVDFHPNFVLLILTDNVNCEVGFQHLSCTLQVKIRSVSVVFPESFKIANGISQSFI
ncbi:unnamed protein product [Fraxinus pennsylvanica]|uniref:Uncharacterized protein n=1 Tax=Fraxinus pennsylvanica TaxID=56036 RepID=A0AAD2DI13_9LAMI|nr:unnamed protein product [Fraxinus pennsylvanica]